MRLGWVRVRVRIRLGQTQTSNLATNSVGTSADAF